MITAEKVRPILMLFGGFLGAGKTTTVRSLIRMLREMGKRVAVVTNDQAADLVDTAVIVTESVSVAEVAGSCFCCGFSQMMERIRALSVSDRPDFILLEPVGSCTDIRATVIEPLNQLYADDWQMGTHIVVLDPGRAIEMLDDMTKPRYSKGARHIFQTQLAEADVVVINKVDAFDEAMVTRVHHLIQQTNSSARILSISNYTQLGLDKLLDVVLQPHVMGDRNDIDVDYDVYAAGEAEMGWLNTRVSLSHAAGFDLDWIVIDVLRRTVVRLENSNIEPAHVKASLGYGEHLSVANVVGAHLFPQLSRQSGICAASGTLTLNARAFGAPDAIKTAVVAAVETACHEAGIGLEWKGLSCFRPDRPVPEHRLRSLKPSGMSGLAKVQEVLAE